MTPHVEQVRSDALYGSLLRAEEENQQRRQTLGNAAVQYARRLTALGAATAAILASGPLVGETVSTENLSFTNSVPEALVLPAPPVPPKPKVIAHVANTQTVKPHSDKATEAIALPAATTPEPAPQTSYSQTGGIRVKLHSKKAPSTTVLPSPNTPKPAINPTHNQTSELSSTWITDFPEGYYMGLIYADKDNVVYRISTTGHGFDYGELVVKGIHKCGYVKKGIIKTRPANNKQRRDCLPYIKPLQHPSTHFRKINCKPGSCSDGQQIRVEAACNHNVYGNFATATKSALNLYPTRKNSGFSLYIGKQYDRVLWRGDLLHGSKQGKASDVRSKSLAAWGFMSKSCTTTANSPTSIILVP